MLALTQTPKRLNSQAPAGTAARVQTPLDLRPTPRPVPREYFGIHIHRAVPVADGSVASWPQIGVGSWRLWGSYVSWAELEPKPQIWRFDRLDSLVSMAAKHRVAVYLTLGRTPRWASARPDERSEYGDGEAAPPIDLDAWSNYVGTVARRYRGRIAAYEIWNEPNLPGFFSGSISEMVALSGRAYAAIKREDPEAIVISPSATGGMQGVAWLSRYFANGGADFTDVVGFHSYATNDTPESMISALIAARQLADSTRGGLPLWITEVGWFIQNKDGTVVPGAAPGGFDATVVPDTLGAAYVARSLILARCAGAQRVMWYAWDNRRMGLTEGDLSTPKAAANAYRQVARWLAGNTLTRCQRDSSGSWRVTVAMARGGSTVLVWNEVPTESLASLGRDDVSAIGRPATRAQRSRLLQFGMPFAHRLQ